jgi:hypothetical protein
MVARIYARTARPRRGKGALSREANQRDSRLASLREIGRTPRRGLAGEHEEVFLVGLQMRFVTSEKRFEQGFSIL